MLNTINLRNFKLHKDTTIDFGKINVFIGPNNSGKSSVSHAFQVLKKDILLKEERVEGEEKEKKGKIDNDASAKDRYIDIGDDGDALDDLIRHGEKSFKIEIHGTIFLRDFLSHSGLEAAKKFISDDKIEIFSTYIYVLQNKTLSFLSHKIHFSGSNKLFDEDKFKKVFKEMNKIREMLEGKKIEGKFKAKDNDMFVEFIAKDIFDEKEIMELNAYREMFKRHRQQYERLLEGISNDPMEEFVGVLLASPGRLIKSTGFVYPIRGLETLAYKTTDKKTSKLNIDSTTLTSRAQSVANAFIYNRMLEDEIYKKMKDVVDVRFFAELGETKDEVKLVSKRNNVPFLFEGLGAHQMLFMLLPIILAKRNSTIFIEEPENHLHPKAQYELANLFVDVVNKQEKQLVITTHSEHVVFGLLNLVTKKKLKPDEIAVYYFENKNGNAEVERLKINEFGQVAGGLPGFFEENLDELIQSLENLE